MHGVVLSFADTAKDSKLLTVRFRLEGGDVMEVMPGSLPGNVVAAGKTFRLLKPAEALANGVCNVNDGK